MSAHALHLDHVTLQLTEMSQAIRLEERLGLEAILTPMDPEHHGRILFDRSYIELTVPVGGPPVDPPWVLPWYFLRFGDEPEPLLERLTRAGLSPNLQMFEGDDGFWTEIRLDLPRTMAPPLLIHRPARRAPEPGFPPPLANSQPCGAFRLAGVLVVTPELSTAVDAYRRLLGLPEVPREFPDRVFRARRIDLPLPGGSIAVLEPDAPGFAASHLSLRGPGPMGLTLAVESFWQPEELLGRLGIGTERNITPTGAELWIDPRETFGVSFGFVEALPPHP